MAHKAVHIKTLQQILVYVAWTIMALLLGIAYMRIVLGPNQITTEGLAYLLHIFYDLGLIHIGVSVGAVIALLFIVLDVFYLKRQLKNSARPTLLRFGVMLCIAVVVGILHYVLEKVVDVI